MKKRAIFLVFVFGLLFSACSFYSPPAGPNNENGQRAAKTPRTKKTPPGDLKAITGTVVHISDGDTFIVETDAGERIKIRIHGIDTPELHQTFGTQSREQLRALIANQPVEVRKKATDRYQRTVAQVFIDGKDIGLEMVRGGYAWHYKQYQKEQSPDDRKLYADAETGARQARLGLWGGDNPQSPQEYRRARKK